MARSFARLALAASVAVALAGPAAAFDHARLAGVLSHTEAGKVDYSAIRARQPELEAYLDSVAAASGPQKLGFYLNAYNALVIQALLAQPTLPAKVTDVDGFFDGKKHSVGGRSLTLNELETMVRTTWRDPRIHFALNCGAVSCPPLRAVPFPEDEVALNTVLSDLTTKFLNGSGFSVDESRRELVVTRLMDWYKDDFIAQEGSVENYLRKWVTDARKKAQLESGLAAGYALTFQAYDWRPNNR